MTIRISPINNQEVNKNMSFGHVKYSKGAQRFLLKKYSKIADVSKRSELMGKIRYFDSSSLEKSSFRAILSKAFLGGLVLHVVDTATKKYAVPNKEFKINLDDDKPFELAENYAACLEEDRKFFDHIREKTATSKDYVPGPTQVKSESEEPIDLNI